MGDTNLEARSLSTDIIRLLFSTLDRPAYWLLGLSYQLFFNVASASLFNGETIMNFYKRIQLIIGVYMMFQLAVIILKGIMNPDSFTDSKSGAGTIIKRVMISLVLLTLLVPISIPKQNKNEWEKQLNNNGLLFGTLYSLQNRILNTNTLGRLILGTDDSAEVFDDGSGSSDSSLAKSARIFTSTILKGFYRINLKPGKEDATKNENRVCEDIDDEILNAYTRLDAEPGEIIGMVQEHCTPNFDIPIIGVDFWTGRERYIFAYMPFISAVVGFIFVFILLDFTVQIAVRAVKLAVLRLLAPIPIISYMDPKGSKDSAFNAWVKSLTSTYLDLFLRLATIYFVLFLVQDMIVNGIFINNAKGILGAVSFIFILVGLFVFAKQAPKFIKQIFGIKDEGDKLFSGIGNLAALGAATIGALGSGIASAKASRYSDDERAREDSSYDPSSLVNRGKHLLAGMFGGMAGFGVGAKAGLTAKDHASRAVFDTISKRNASVLSSGRSGGTLFGAMGSDLRQMAFGESYYGALDSKLKAEEQKIKDAELLLKQAEANNAHRKSIMDRAKSKAVDSDKTTGAYKYGNQTIVGNYRNYHSVYTAAIQQGTGVYQNASGESVFKFNDQEIRLADAQSVDLGLLDENIANFYERAVADASFDASITADRNAYRAATGSDLEEKFGKLKAEFGNNSSKNTAESDRLTRQRAEVNKERQSYQSQRAEANSKRFRQGK